MQIGRCSGDIAAAESLHIIPAIEENRKVWYDARKENGGDGSRMEWRIMYLEETGSTNADAAEAGRKGEAAGLVVTAGKQTAGRGRMNRSWYSPSGAGLYCSVLLRPALSAEQAGLLSFCAANAMTEAVRAAGFDAGIKWPNDVLCQERKICGILSVCDAAGGRLRFAVIGSGLNLRRGAYPEELRERAACLEEFGKVPEKEVLLRDYLAALEREVRDLEEQGFEPVRKRYEARCVLTGRQVRVLGREETAGTVTGIGHAGELKLQMPDGQERDFLTGDVSVRGVKGYV